LISVLLVILKYALFALLFLLALILVPLCLLLFIPFTYKTEAGKGINAKLTVKWLFGALAMRMEYVNKKLITNYLIFGRKRKRRRKNKLKKEPNKESKEGAKKTAQKTAKKTKENQKRRESKKPKKKKPPKEDRSKNLFQTFIRIMKHPERGIITEKTALLLKRLCRPFKPKVFHLSGEAGFTDPCATGKFIAAEALFVGFTGFNVNIKGNFERQCFNIDFKAAGSLMLFSLTWPLMIYIFSKPIWKIVRSYFSRNEEELGEE